MSTKICKETWILFYDGACPMCQKIKDNIAHNIDTHIRLTVVNLNSEIAKNRGYSLNNPVLETPSGIYVGFDVVWQLLGVSKYKCLRKRIFKPLIRFLYFGLFVSRMVIKRFV